MKKTTTTKSTPSSKRFRVERRGSSTSTRNWQPLSRAGFRAVGRNDMQAAESLYEKQMLLPVVGNDQPRDHAWAVARFCCDIMAEHALFFSLLMPPEVAQSERTAAIAFEAQFQKICNRLDAKGPPGSSEVRGFVRTVCQDIQPLIDYKRENHRAQVSGELQSMVWPLFFDHTAREAERWVGRLQDIATGNVELDAKEVVPFWASIMDDHFRFIAHLLDPDEHALIRKAYQNSSSFQSVLGVRQGTAAMLAPLHSRPTGEDPKMILAMANEVLEFKTDAARQIEAAKIRSIISPILADHVRREAVWFVDEVKRLDQ